MKTETQKEFLGLWKKMKPNMPRCRPLSTRAFAHSTEQEQDEYLIWLKAMHNTAYRRLMNLLRDLSEEQWKIRMQLYPDLPEIVLRRKFEKELRLIWEETIPLGLLRTKQEKSLPSSESSNEE